MSRAAPWPRCTAPDAVAISLDPIHLPNYAIRTTLRMFAALVASLLFTLVYATWAAKSRRARLILIPVLDILQSVPILGFLSFTVVFFMSLFPGRVLGAEFAAIFAIFTSQAWNMTFSLYQSLTTIPRDLDEASRSFQLSAWQRFWRLEVPFAMPGLVWNTMMSMSGGWFFVVAAEAISVGDHHLEAARHRLLCGGGARAARSRRGVLGDLRHARGHPGLRPDAVPPAGRLVGQVPLRDHLGRQPPDPWLLALLRRTRTLRLVGGWVSNGIGALGGLRLALPIRRAGGPRPVARHRRDLVRRAGGSRWPRRCGRSSTSSSATLTWTDVLEALGLGCITLLRVVVLMILASLIWVPIGVWLGLRPAWARRAQPVAQFLAAFPANLLFPPFVVVIVHFGLNADIWLTPLMVLGTQWYILFNVIAGAAAFPGDLREVADNFQVGGWLWWRRVILPGIFPYYVTGAITASGGSWNAAIVAEVASWGDSKADGARPRRLYRAGDRCRRTRRAIVLGVAVMSAFVVAFNRLLWRPLYGFASRRLTFA